MATTPKNWQSTLNTSANVVTLVTAGASGSQVSSLYLMNTNTTTARTVTILAKGSGILAANVIAVITIQPNDFVILQNPNCPIVLSSAETLRLYQDSGTDITATAFGLDL
jgi:hypothetical protein